MLGRLYHSDAWWSICVTYACPLLQHCVAATCGELLRQALDETTSFQGSMVTPDDVSLVTCISFKVLPKAATLRCMLQIAQQHMLLKLHGFSWQSLLCHLCLHAAILQHVLTEVPQ